MLFVEALEALKAGKQVVRRSWGETDGYLTFLAGMNHVWKIITSPAPNAGNHIFSVNELSADDWELLGYVTPQVEVTQDHCVEL
jgi:hypothetical protein